MPELSPQDEQLRIQIAQRIKSLREASGMNQAEFAREHLIDRQTLNRWENGRGVTIYTVNKFCDFVNISLGDFFSKEFN